MIDPRNLSKESFTLPECRLSIDGPMQPFDHANGDWTYYHFLYRTPGSIGHNSVRQTLHIIRKRDKMLWPERDCDRGWVFTRTIKPDDDKFFTFNQPAPDLDVSIGKVVFFSHIRPQNRDNSARATGDKS